MGKTVRTKRRNEADPSDLERFVQLTTSMKYWPDINAMSDIGVVRGKCYQKYQRIAASPDHLLMQRSQRRLPFRPTTIDRIGRTGGSDMP
jgi:hypothetical protein